MVIRKKRRIASRFLLYVAFDSYNFIHIIFLIYCHIIYFIFNTTKDETI